LLLAEGIVRFVWPTSGEKISARDVTALMRISRKFVWPAASKIAKFLIKKGPVFVILVKNYLAID